jgi:hypothetical protein
MSNNHSPNHDAIPGTDRGCPGCIEAETVDLREAHRNESAGLDNWRNRAERAEAQLAEFIAMDSNNAEVGLALADEAVRREEDLSAQRDAMTAALAEVLTLIIAGNLRHQYDQPELMTAMEILKAIRDNEPDRLSVLLAESSR